MCVCLLRMEKLVLKQSLDKESGMSATTISDTVTVSDKCITKE